MTPVLTPLGAKRALKRTAGLASVLMRLGTPSSSHAQACVLTYHRVTAANVEESRLDDWNITPATLDTHLAWLSEHTDLVFVRELTGRLAQSGHAERPLACLTFDDGYQNFHDEVLPLLERYRAKATLFVVTGFVGASTPMTFDRWGARHEHDAPPKAWRAIDWPSLERLVDSGLVEIGGHSHRHADGRTLSPLALASEATESRQILADRLGADRIRSYAYPYGSTRLGHVTPEYVAAVSAAGYQYAVTTDIGLATAASHPLRLPRVEASRSDSPAVIRAKVGGVLAPFLLTDRLRRAQR